MNPDLKTALDRVLGYVRRWQIPSHWQPADWRDELQAVASLAVLEAEGGYDPDLGVPLCGYAFVCAWAALRKYYRKEWWYVCRCVSFSEEGKTSEILPFDPPDPTSQAFVEEMDLCEVVNHALEALPKREREALIQLYWSEQTEREAARALGLSPASLHEYKERAITKLRILLEESGF